MSFVVVRRVAVLAVLVGAMTILPIRTAWSAPSVRLDELPAEPGEIVDLTHPSSHLGVRWIGAETDGMELRWRAQGARWSPWETVELSHDLGDDAAGIRLSGLLIATDAIDAQVRVVSGTPQHIEVVAIDTQHGPRHLVVEHPQAMAQSAPPSPPSSSPPPVPQPGVITRAQWGADESLKGSDPPQFATVRRLALHHTAGAEGDDPAATVRAIYAYHTQSNGWNDIGYNFLVDSSGRIYEGRRAREYAAGEIPTGEDTEMRGVIGAHISGNNTGTVGIALLGNFAAEDRPTAAAINGAERMFAWKADRFDIDVLGQTTWTSGLRSTLIGHRDAGATACPGDALYEQLPGMRQRIAEVVGPVKPKPFTSGYWIVGRDAGVYNFGNSAYLGGAQEIPTPAVSMAASRSGNGYWLLSANGHVSAYGDAAFFGSTESLKLNAPAVRLEPTRSGNGYWIQAADGGIFSFGDAAFYGSTGGIKLNSPVVSMSATPSGRGYWLLAADGGVFTFGDGDFFGSTGNLKLNAPVVSMSPRPNGRGYWLQAGDGGIFSFGDVNFYGSVPGLGLSGTAQTVQIRATPTGEGYYVMGADGGIFTFGDSRFYGSKPGLRDNSSAIDLAIRNS